MLKLTDEQAAELGISSFEDIKAKFAGIPKLKAENEAFLGRISALETGLTEVRSAISALPKIDTAAIVKDAVTQSAAASETISAKAVSSAIARAGTQGLAPNKPAGEGNDPGKPTPAADDYKAQWDADPKLRADFRSLASYEAYMKGKAAGQVLN